MHIIFTFFKHFINWRLWRKHWKHVLICWAGLFVRCHHQNVWVYLQISISITGDTVLGCTSCHFCTMLSESLPVLSDFWITLSSFWFWLLLLQINIIILVLVRQYDNVHCSFASTILAYQSVQSVFHPITSGSVKWGATIYMEVN